MLLTINVLNINIKKTVAPLLSITIPSYHRSVNVKVPGGVENGIAIQIRGEGAEGDPGAPKGDLYVQVEVEADPYFERSGADVHVTAHVTLAQVR